MFCCCLPNKRCCGCEAWLEIMFVSTKLPPPIHSHPNSGALTPLCSENHFAIFYHNEKLLLVSCQPWQFWSFERKMQSGNLRDVLWLNELTYISGELILLLQATSNEDLDEIEKEKSRFGLCSWLHQAAASQTSKFPPHPPQSAAQIKFRFISPPFNIIANQLRLASVYLTILIRLYVSVQPHLFSIFLIARV